MAHFKDLSVCTYSCPPEFGRLSVGWLAMGAPFPTGPVSDEFLAALHTLCSDHVVRLCFGHHVCEFCEGASWGDPYFLEMGNGEIEIRGADGTWYEAPRLIAHYVSEHDYCPPPEFIEAVLNPSEISKEFDPANCTEEEQARWLKELEWEGRQEE